MPGPDAGHAAGRLAASSTALRQLARDLAHAGAVDDGSRESGGSGESRGSGESGEAGEADGGTTPTAAELAALGLSGRSAQVLAHLLGTGPRSVARIAIETGVADSVVSRSVRDLVGHGLVRQRDSRPSSVGVAPGLGAAARAVAAEVRRAADDRSSDLDRLAERLDHLDTREDAEAHRYWLVPLRADALAYEIPVRRVHRSLDVCVPAGRRPRGVMTSRSPSGGIAWRVLVQEGWPPRSFSVPAWAALEVHGCRRTAWCSDPGLVALAVAAFEHWWQTADPVV